MLCFEFYVSAHAPVWNAWVAGSRNGSFLFDRRFMDYHADRFVDASLMAYDGARLVAVLPAHREGAQLVSHAGLSYGGFVLGEGGGQRTVLALFDVLLAWMGGQGLRSLKYKTLPAPYHRLPSEEDRYAMYRLGAQPWRCDVLSMIPPDGGAPASHGRRHALRHARRQCGLDVHEDDRWADFWPVLSQVLRARHDAAPTHSLAEMERLASRFPQQIRLVCAWHGQVVVAGAVLFQTTRVTRVQYMASGDEGRRLGALDRVLEVIASQTLAAGRWLDFGASTEEGGARLNEGLVDFKESFGARTVVHQGYELAV
jgi:hypothetical protein